MITKSDADKPMDVEIERKIDLQKDIYDQLDHMGGLCSKLWGIS